MSKDYKHQIGQRIMMRTFIEIILFVAIASLCIVLTECGASSSSYSYDYDPFDYNPESSYDPNYYNRQPSQPSQPMQPIQPRQHDPRGEQRGRKEIVQVEGEILVKQPFTPQELAIQGYTLDDCEYFCTEIIERGFGYFIKDGKCWCKKYFTGTRYIVKSP